MAEPAAVILRHAARKKKNLDVLLKLLSLLHDHGLHSSLNQSSESQGSQQA